MKIAAIDLGSNSFHLIVAETRATGAFHVVAGEKDMVRLGARTLSRGQLPAAAMRRGLDVLRAYKRLTVTHGVDKVIAVATSAIREAGNGEDYLDRIGRETGLWPRAISGEQEARLIYLSALHSIHLEGKKTLLLDIGGGSVELALGSLTRPDMVFSEKLGVLRLGETYVTTDPLSPRDERRIEKHVEDAIAPHVAKIRQAGFECVVGTSGTILSLGQLAHEHEGGARTETLHHLSVRADSVHAVRRRLVALGLKERLRLRGLDPERADIIVPGVILLDTILRAVGAREITLCEWGLREGVVLNYVTRHPKTLARAEEYPDVRRRSVVELAERCLYDEAHSRHVAGLALSIFDGTKKRHRLAERERSILEYAALLHDVGHHISHIRHHRHSYYLIKNGDLRGFTPEEIEILANVARYHRRGTPRRKHVGFGSLPAPSRRIVRILAGFLKLADALDRSHRQTVRSVTVKPRRGAVLVVCLATGDVELEMWGARRRLDLIAETLGVPVRLEDARAPAEAGNVRRFARRETRHG
ncbi:MAG: Ppx/GppA family phosphatase [Acidobacteria bacterium]|nr:Ppx/GppA family phosphatase [Acidobacteriota bacterium]